MACGLIRRKKRGTPAGPPGSNGNGNGSQTRPGVSPVEPLFPDGVKVLHDCPDAAVDVCFVHGLMGNRDSTWTANGQSTPWPQTLLPPHLPRARILTFGYDAYVVRGSVASKNRLMDHAASLLNDLTNDREACGASARPLIFVAHSLGGLVCKEAIMRSRHHPEPHQRAVFGCVRGVVFMGTPHRGSWMATWAKTLTSALVLAKSANGSLLKVLETDDQLLESIHIRFSDMIRELREARRRFEIACFYEELPLPAFGKVVSKESATLDGYVSISIRADHRNMVRFASADDTGFKRLHGELVRWASRPRSSGGQTSPSGVPEDDPGVAPVYHYGPGTHNAGTVPTSGQGQGASGQHALGMT